MNRSTEFRLRRAFAEILATCLATTAAAAVVNCSSGSTAGLEPDGGSGNDAGEPIDGSSPSDGGDGYASLCGKYSKPLIQGIQAEPPVDFVTQRSETKKLSGEPSLDGGADGGNDGGIDDWAATDGDSVGTKCATATDKAACEAAAAAYRILPTDDEECRSKYGGYFDGNFCTVSYLLYTRKDEVASAETFEETKALLGSVSNIEEALLLAQRKERDYRINCPAEGSSGDLPESEYRARADGGFDLRLLKEPGCSYMEDCYVHVDGSGNVQEDSCTKTDRSTACAGRRPEGFVGTPITRNAEAGEYFAHMAELEAASVVAFQRLHDDLKAFGAPNELLARVRKAERDEVRHARDTSSLARRYGREPRVPRVDEGRESPTLFSLALENAREGCVRETYGALVAHVQAARAEDPVVATSMQAIAREETEHAALSWDVAAWLEAQLDEAACAILRRERELTVAELAEALAQTPVSDDARRVTGLPRPEEATALLASLEPTVLAA